MSMKLQFSPVEDEKLIADVSNHPVLFDSREKNYKNNGAKGLVWETVAVKVNRTADDCKKRWRSIRDTFKKIKRGKKYRTRRKIKWPLMDKLSFLDNPLFETRQSLFYSTRNRDEHIIEKVRKRSNSSDSDNSEIPTGCATSLEAELQNNISHSTKKRICASSSVPQRHRTDSLSDDVLDVLERRSLEREKLLDNISRTVEDDCDATLIFFKSMAMTVKKFPPHLVAEAKIAVLKIINDLDIKSSQATCNCACHTANVPWL